MSLHPKYEGQVCRGYDLSNTPLEELQAIRRLDLRYLLEFYNQAPDKGHFFEQTSDLLAGSDRLRKQIMAGMLETEIRQSWQPGLNAFKEMLKKYVLYKE